MDIKRIAALCVVSGGVLAAAVLVLVSGAEAGEETVCTVIANASDGAVLLEEGDCARRVTPASTFKVALAAMGYDAGILTDAHSPRLPYEEGYPNWGGDAWRQPADPARWMRYSVVWYSQQMTPQLGLQRLEAYARDFGFGNADLSGDDGKGNALTDSWIDSSLRISPKEQIAFLTRLRNRALPISAEAADKTIGLMPLYQAGDGWTVHGKTGSALIRGERKSGGRTPAVGWFVGWAEKGDRTLVFARLNHYEGDWNGIPGLLTRTGLLDDFAGLATQSGNTSAQ